MHIKRVMFDNSVMISKAGLLNAGQTLSGVIANGGRQKGGPLIAASTRPFQTTTQQNLISQLSRMYCPRSQRNYWITRKTLARFNRGKNKQNIFTFSSNQETSDRMTLPELSQLDKTKKTFPFYSFRKARDISVVLNLPSITFAFSFYQTHLGWSFSSMFIWEFQIFFIAVRRAAEKWRSTLFFFCYAESLRVLLLLRPLLCIW